VSKLTPEEQDWRHGVPEDKRMGEILRLRAINADLLAALTGLTITMREQLASLVDKGEVNASKTSAAFKQADAAIAKARETK